MQIHPMLKKELEKWLHHDDKKEEVKVENNEIETLNDVPADKVENVQLLEQHKEMLETNTEARIVRFVQLLYVLYSYLYKKSDDFC